VARHFRRFCIKREHRWRGRVIRSVEPEVAFASLWEAREGPWETVRGTVGGGIFKSTDGGKTLETTVHRFAEGIIQANLAIAPALRGA